MINLIIDNQPVQVEEGTTLLQAAEKLGIKIPTLCYHKALSPYGACRLCLVEVDAGGRKSLQASCTYPAMEGLVVNTRTEKVIQTRKIIIELFLARCPEVETIQQLAKEYGISETRFEQINENCTLCGLCVRMCHERMGIGAINFFNRGSKRKVGPPFEAVSDLCQTCGACEFICPANRIQVKQVSKRPVRPIRYEYNEGLISRSAIYIPYPQAVPNKATIDDRYCVHMLKDECGICKEMCEADAINYAQKDEQLDINVGSIILSPGFNQFKGSQKLEYGYWNFPNVVTAIEFERILSATGPYQGKVLRPSDKTPPRKIAFIQCVGSRDHEHGYCSSICCMYATKEAIIAKEHSSEPLECHIYYMDLRAFGKGFDDYYNRAKELGVKYIRCRPSAVEEIKDTGNLVIRYIDDNGKPLSEEYDMVVLSTGLKPPESVKDLSHTCRFALNEHGFCQTVPFDPVRTTREGIFACGPFTEPKDIPETVMQASCAASKSLALLSEAKGSLITVKEFPPEINVLGQPPRIGVFICHCGTNIGGVVNVPEVVEYARTLPDVVYAEDNLYTCSNDTQERIKRKIAEHGLNRVIVASCTPRTHEPLFQSTCREAGLNPYLFEMANIRDQCSWAHMHEPKRATEKSKDLVRMAVAKSRFIQPLYRKSVSVNHSALVIGGGASGMNAALDLADSGFKVHLVEREKELGGNLRRIYFMLKPGLDPQKYLHDLIRRVQSHERIQVHLNTEVEDVQGSVGNFKTTLKPVGGKPSEEVIDHGIVIVATGAEEFQPAEYLYGKDDRVVTQLQLEHMLASGKFREMFSESQVPKKKSKKGRTKNVVMIQCVGSRDDERPYCSRVCCAQAIKNALKIKEISPQTNVIILFRDIRTYGFAEEYYREAREKGVIFIRYEENRKPEVELVKSDGENIEPAPAEQLQVTVYDPILQRKFVIPTDLLTLSAATVPHADNEKLSQILKVPLNADRFFLEAHMKLRPVDFSADGVFLCGIAHCPKSLEESIVQAGAAAARASTILSRDRMELEANVSRVTEEYCNGCGLCVNSCPYQALSLDITYLNDGTPRKIVIKDETACKGCGSCVAACPSGAMEQNGFKNDQLLSMLEAALE